MPSIVLLHTTNEFETIGQQWRIDQWLPHNGGWYTIGMSVENFKGRIWLEGSLATNPTDNDWFPIWMQLKNPYLQFPVNVKAPTGTNGGDSHTVAYKFQANLLWLRARLDRSYLARPSIGVNPYGVINQIIVSL